MASTHDAPDTAGARVCIVGAGSSGLIAAKVAKERGLPFDCFELASDVGGLWRYGSDSGRSPAYASLQANTSRDRTAFRCFPMPEHFPDFPHHSQLLRYFEAFADRFGLRERIAFRTKVERVLPAPSAASGEPPFDVTVRDLETGSTRTARYSAVLVASGHHWDPALPEPPGSFDGETIHSRDYRTPDMLEGRRVLVVGIGNSACDIACEAAGVAGRTLLSTRRGAHVLPKYLLGRPLDRWITPLSSRLPFGVQRAFLSLLLRLERGDQERFGIPKPPHRLGEEHPTISQRLPELAERGDVEVKPDVERLAGDRVRFADGSEERVDVIVYATGYRISFPFLAPAFPELARPEGNRPRLYLHVVPPDVPGLYFLGLVQPLGAIMPLAEAQAEWVADLLEGVAVLPPRPAMEAAIEETERGLRERFVASRRHTLEVDFYRYLRMVERERRRGRARPRAGSSLRPAPSGSGGGRGPAGGREPPARRPAGPPPATG